MTPVIIDFGLSKVMLGGQTSTDPYGTLAYCSPEIVHKSEHTEKTDVWSMGVILYIMLSQRMPFLSNESDLITKYNILNKEITLSSETWNKISEHGRDLVRKMLTRDKRQRITLE
jgi:serine/threonine protein kinase